MYTQVLLGFCHTSQLLLLGGAVITAQGDRQAGWLWDQGRE